MRQASNGECGEDGPGYSQSHTSAIIQRKRRSALCWRAFAVRSALLSFVAKKESTRTSITDGRRNFWRPARSGWLATRRETRPRTRKELKAEARQLKETLAEVLIENRLLKKSVLGDGENA